MNTAQKTCKHTISVRQGDARIVCRDCHRGFDDFQAVCYLERVLDSKPGLAYWREIRKIRDFAKIQRRRGAEIEFEGGYWVPEKVGE